MMTPFKTLFAVLLLLTAGSDLFSQDAGKKEAEKKALTSLRFHGGTVLSAEFMPEGFLNPTVLNVSRFEPPSRITSDIAYATVIVKLDSGRSLSIYDYTLINRRKDEFKCIGVREGDGPYDAERWEIPDTKPDRLYSLLFKVQLPAFNDRNEYTLRYMLNKSKPEDLLIPFVKINRAFTLASKIPAEGIIGIDSEPPPPPPKPAEEVKKDNAQAPTKEEASPASDSMLKFVPDAKTDEAIYVLDLVKSNDVVKYEVDKHLTFNKPFDRISYYVELKTEAGELQYVYVSMDAFTSDLGKIGVPTVESKAKFQQLVNNMNVSSNVKGIVTGNGLKGNIEFWPNNYNEKNVSSVPNASDTVMDFGDEVVEPESGYGSMQIHNYDAKQTVFAYNNWREGNNADLGFGNSTGKATDWTFTKNSGTYKVKLIKILVHPK